MKNLFLFTVSTLLLLGLKAMPKKHQLERLYVKQSQFVGFKGVVFLPRTLTPQGAEVKQASFKLRIAGNSYTYTRLYETGAFFLDPSQSVREIDVEHKDMIGSDFEIRLFAEREV